MKPKRIHCTKEKTEITWKVKAETGGWIEKSESSPDPISEDFQEALDNLKTDLLYLCEESGTDEELVHVTGCSLSYKGQNETLNVVITGYKTYKTSNGAMPMNSPLKAAFKDPGEPTASENILPDGCLDKVKKLIGLAFEYIDQDPTQVEMDFEPPPETESDNVDLLNNDDVTAPAEV